MLVERRTSAFGVCLNEKPKQNEEELLVYSKNEEFLVERITIISTVKIKRLLVELSELVNNFSLNILYAHFTSHNVDPEIPCF